MKRPVVIGLLVVALLFVLVGIGAVVFFAARGSNVNFFSFGPSQVSATTEEAKTLKIDAKKTLTLIVADAAGDVTVTGADVDKVEVKVVKTAYDNTQAGADQELKNIKYSIEQTGNTIYLKYEVLTSLNFGDRISTVDFIVTVPDETRVSVDTTGDVTVTGIKGDADLNTGFGDLRVENLDGALSVDTSNGDIHAVSVDTGGKDVSVNSSFGDITLEQIKSRGIKLDSSNGVIKLANIRTSGEVFTESDFGNIHIENGICDSLNLDSSNGKIKITKLTVKNKLSIDNNFGDIDLTGVIAGSYDLKTSNGDLTIDGVKGSFKAKSNFGDIAIINGTSVMLDLDTSNGNIEFTGSLGDGPHKIETNFGSVTLSIPDDTNLNVSLTTSFGDITSEIPITITLTDDVKKNEQRGSMNEGGGLLTIDTSNGDIRIKAIK